MAAERGAYQEARINLRRFPGPGAAGIASPPQSVFRVIPFSLQPIVQGPSGDSEYLGDLSDGMVGLNGADRT